MKEDYLWDKSGEPDPEIQELERVLGTLRYQPRPLEIPADLVPQRNRSLTARFLAIAATIAIMLLGAGLWFGLHRTQSTQVSKGESGLVKTGGSNQTAAVPQNTESRPAPVPPSPDGGDKRIRHRVNPGGPSHELAANRRPKLNTRGLTPSERKEAEAAREQLMLALRVASSKLNFAQKKAQEINSQNLTHNQHKVG